MSSNVIDLSSMVPVSIEDEMKKSYLDYAMSVIVSRALPDARDGLKPVHRRILYAMHEANNYHDRPYKKSARVVGDVMGKYHPHGDSAIYSSLVRMAQDFSLRLPLIDGQGNFGSMDGDSPAQMRYTEVRLEKVSSSILNDINLDTVDFVDNYDGAETEPTVLPARFPNLLVNGTNGIAVGMATNIPTHNLGEVIDACCAYIENREITLEELLEHVPAPDFPTGGIILGGGRAKTALSTGRGSVIVRAKTDFEEIGGKQAIIVTEVPYQVNKAELLSRAESLAKDKVIEGIAEMRDESNKLGIRIVIEVKKGFVPDVILNQLYKYTSLQTSFSYNMLALDHGQPRTMNLQSVIKIFIAFREEVVTRRVSNLLSKARDKAHLLIGLSLAVANIDEVIALIRSAPDPATAKAQLMEKDWNAETVIPLLKLVDDYRNELIDNRCKFTEEQAKAILEMKLQKLTGLEKEKIDEELKSLSVEIIDHLDILGSHERLMKVITEELLEVKEKFATPRRTSVELNEADVDFEDLIQKEDMVVTTTIKGYIKRVPLATYRAQKRGGKGRAALSMHDDDFTNEIIVTNTHVPLLFFSDKGKVYRTKVYRLPLGSPQSKGRALINTFPLEQDEKITTVMPLPEDKETWDQFNIIFATRKGNVRRNDLAAFSNINANGKIAIRLDEDDKLIDVKVCKSDDHIIISTREGKSIRFSVDAVRVFKSRTSDGVRGIRLAKKDDAVISMAILQGAEIEMIKRDNYLKIDQQLRNEISKHSEIDSANDSLNKVAAESLNSEEVFALAQNEEYLLSITENGYGKRTSAYEYRTAGRGGQGIFNIDTEERNGKVIATFPVEEDDEIILVTDGGTLIRTSVKDIRITGRNAKGVKVINTKNSEKVISVTRIRDNDTEESIANENDDEEVVSETDQNV